MVGFSLSLSCSCKLSLRNSLEAKLALNAMLKYKLCLELHLKREDAFKKAYINALNAGKVFEYQGHGLTFEYALVKKAWLPKGITEATGHGIAHCLFNAFEAIICGNKFALSRGAWLLFVVEDCYSEPLPQKAIEYAACHEYGEQVTLGEHNEASKLEFAIAKKESKLMWYMDWIEANCPAKLADVFTYQIHTQAPSDNEEFEQVMYDTYHSCEAKSVRELIETFEWPYKLLQRLSKYNNANALSKQLLSRQCN